MSFSFFWEKIAGREPTPNFMVRNVLGTGISDRHIPFSFTLYSFTYEELDGNDIFRLTQFFEDKLVRWLKSRYPRANYNMSDWEDWGKPIIREGKNQFVDLDLDYFDSYSFEINGSEESHGDIADIL